ncbi:MAG: PilZ domain-containing protein, partial [Myxococcales bacterium]|nr:PilZ domain-containing protein [Myxococcales bacterium]
MDSIDDPKDERTQARVPVEIPVELGYGDFEDSFEAAALNVSRGGLSMRAPCLPDVGARLMCRFECGPAAITAQGEVVWAQLDDRSSGEFGLCFVDLDPHTELLIEEMIAEQVAHAGAVEDPSEIAAPVAKLELEGSPEPIAARLAHAERGEAVFEQELDLLSVGRAVFARELADGEKRGSISGVELRMMGNVPTLAVTVSFDGQPSFGEFEWDGRSDDAEVHDTEPDMAAPAEGPIEPPAPMSVTTVTEYDGGAVAPDDGSPETGEGWTWSSSSGVVDTRDPAADSDLAAALMTEAAPAPAPPRQVELDLAADQGGELEPTPQATVSPALVEATNLRTHAGAPRSGAEADGVAVTEPVAAAEPVVAAESMAESASATESELATESAPEPEPEPEPVTYGLRME